jgi:hypothetical protein
MEKDEVQMESIYSIDLQSASLALLEQLNTFAIDPTPPLAVIEQWASTSSPSASQSQLYDALSYILLEPVYTEAVAIHFNALLIDITLRALDRIEVGELTWSDIDTRQFYHALARLLHPFPTLLP